MKMWRSIWIYGAIKMRILKLLSVVCLVITGLAIIGMAQQTRQPVAQNREQLAALMRAKLSSSQRVVEGLMSADFNLISKGGDEMLKICDATDWPSREDQVYGHYRAELRRGALKLLKQADAKSLDGSAYTYMHTMTTCINCHEYCRNVLRVAAIPKSKVTPIPVTEEEHATQRFGAILR